MIKIYAGAKIVLNVHSFAGGLYHGLPMRVFEATACGAFLLTDDCAQLRKCFDVGREVAAYSTPDELADQVRFYLDRPELRREMAARARERTLREHTWKERLRGILETLRSAHGSTGSPRAEHAHPEPVEGRRHLLPRGQPR